MAELIKSSGEITPIAPKNGKSFDLQELQGYVGGYIELVRLSDGKVMVVNEEGKLHGLPVNQMASAIYLRDSIVGDVVVCTNRQVK
jgi:hypothetical protein